MKQSARYRAGHVFREKKKQGPDIDCSWLFSPGISFNPRVTDDVAEAFESHECSDHPKKKSREDVNQAAARIVREATED